MGRSRFAIALGVAASLVAMPVSAQSGQFCMPDPGRIAQPQGYGGDNMTYSVRELGGMRILQGVGGIGKDEGARLRQAIQRAGAVDEVWFSSPGGIMVEGLAMGRILRENGLFVRVPANYKCASSCSLAVLGGALRKVDPGAYYGIHMFSGYFDGGAAVGKIGRILKRYDDRKTADGPAAAVQQVQTDMMAEERSTALAAAGLARYLVEMSASLEFLTGMFGQRQLGMCWLNRDGLRRYNVTNID